MAIFKIDGKKFIKAVLQVFKKPEKPVPEKVPDARLTIPSLNIDVGVYIRPNGTADNGQGIVDAEDSAAFIQMGGLSIIADHSHQAHFSHLNFCVPGFTKAYIKWAESGKCDEYICVKSEIGRIELGSNGGNRLYDGDGNPIHTHQKGLCIYTCIILTSPHVMRSRVTFWELA